MVSAEIVNPVIDFLEDLVFRYPVLVQFVVNFSFQFFEVVVQLSQLVEMLVDIFHVSVKIRDGLVDVVPQLTDLLFDLLMIELFGEEFFDPPIDGGDLLSEVKGEFIIQLQQRCLLPVLDVVEFGLEVFRFDVFAGDVLLDDKLDLVYFSVVRG